jgi:hypothetical protein
MSLRLILLAGAMTGEDQIDQRCAGARRVVREAVVRGDAADGVGAGEN